MDFILKNDWLGRSGPFNFSLDYIIYYCVFAVISIGLIVLLTWKRNNKAIKAVLIVLWIIALLCEFGLKLTYTIASKGAWYAYLPLLVSSLFLYIMPFALFFKKHWIRNPSCAFICGLSFVGAILNFVFPVYETSFSLLSFMGLYSTLFQSVLILVPLIMLITGFYRVSMVDFWGGFVAFVIFTIPALICNYVAKTDYMALYNGSSSGLQFVNTISGAVGLIAWPFVMYGLYALIHLFSMGIETLITRIVLFFARHSGKKRSKATTRTTTTTNTVVTSSGLSRPPKN